MNDNNQFSNTQAQPDGAEASQSTAEAPQAVPTSPTENESPQTAANNYTYLAAEAENKSSHLTNTDTVISIVCFALAFVFNRFVCGYAGGIWGGILWLLVGIAAAVYVTLKKVKISVYQGVAFTVAEVFCLVPLFCSNGFINTLAAMFSFLLLFYVGSSLSGTELFGDHFVIDLFGAVFARPFVSFADAPRAAGRVFKKPNTGKNIGLVIVGLVLAVPLTLIVAFLLMSSDQMFEDNMDKLWGSLPEFDFLIIFQLLVAVPVGMYLFGMMSSATKKRDIFYDDEMPSMLRFVPAALGYTMVTPVCIIYLMYIVTQFNYFTAAFGGTLPEEYSYSSYARRGFFELCVVVVINLCIIIAMQVFMKRRDDGSRPAALKIYTAIISVFTLLLITSAISKMVLYINEMGMTPLRIYTSWFMLLLAIIFVLIIAVQFVRLPFWKVLFAAFSVMMGVLCFGNVDGVIADYNVSAYLDGRLDDVDFGVLRECGDAAVVHAARLVGNESDYISANAERLIHDSDICVKGNLPYFNIHRISGEAAAERLSILIY